jgi:hypothetical protein
VVRGGVEPPTFRFFACRRAVNLFDLVRADHLGQPAALAPLRAPPWTAGSLSWAARYCVLGDLATRIAVFDGRWPASPVGGLRRSCDGRLLQADPGLARGDYDAHQPGPRPLEQAIWTRQYAGQDLAGLVHLQGAGSQYTSIAFTERLAGIGAHRRSAPWATPWIKPSLRTHRGDSVSYFGGNGSGGPGARGVSVAVPPGRQSPVGEYDLGPVAGLVPASKEMTVCLSTQWRSRSRRTAPRMRR